MRAGQAQANALQNTAGNTAANYGTTAANISSTLSPFLQRELNSPAGYSQPDETAMLSNALSGAGGVAGGLMTKADQRAGATGNQAGFSSNLDDIARQTAKGAAEASTGVAVKNAALKEEQQQAGAEGLRGRYGTDVGAQLNALGVQNNAINSEVNAGKSGWFQNMTALISALRGGGGGSGGGSPNGGGGGGGSPDTGGDAGIGDADIEDAANAAAGGG